MEYDVDTLCFCEENSYNITVYFVKWFNGIFHTKRTN